MKTTVLCAFVLAASVSITSRASAEPVDVTALNRSSWTLAHVSFSSAGQEQWSPDVLHGTVIALGDGFSFQVPACDSYDLKLVAVDERECVIEALDVCTDRNSLVLSDDALRWCDSPR